MLAGRRAELDAVGRLLGGARAGRAGALLVCGEPGIGKTALLRAAAGSAEGMERLEARGLESEAELPFAGLLDLVRPLVGLLDRLPALQSAVLAAAVALGPRGPDPPDSGPGDRLAVCAAAHALVGHAAAARPHLI